jgi:hypothetical protein
MFFLSSYSVQVRDHANNQILPIDNLGNNNDLLTEWNSYIGSLQHNIQQFVLTQRIMRLRMANQQGRNVSGIIETGDYGYETDLIDRQTNNLSHHRTTNEAELMPFWSAPQKLIQI